jgi:hypothetical protein
MAAGDITVFNEAKGYMIDGGWEAADVIKIALITSAVAPAATDSVPGMNAGATTTYTEVSAGGGYSAGGETLNTLANCVTTSGTTMTFDDTDATIGWTSSASGDPTDARYAIIYNSSDTGLERAIAWMDLGTTVSLLAGDITITWDASGIFTIADA